MSLVVDGLGGTSSGRHTSAPSGFGGAIKNAVDTVKTAVVKTADAARKTAPHPPVSADAEDRRAAAMATQTQSHSSRAGSVASADTAERRATAKAAKADPSTPSSACVFVPAVPETRVVKKDDTIWDYWTEHRTDAEWQPYKADFNQMNAGILADGWLHPGEVATLPPQAGAGNWECTPVPAPPVPAPPVPAPPKTAGALPSGLPPYMYPGWTPPAAPGWHPPMATGTAPAPSSPFSVGPMTDTEKYAVSGVHVLDTGQHIINHLPDFLELPDGAINAMFASDRGQQAAVKIFTPTVTALNPSRGTYTSGAASLKVHGWAAERSEIALSPSWVTDSGTRMRTATISVTAGLQYEAIGEINAPQGDARGFYTVNNAKVISYSITTTESRLKDIMQGEVPAPDPVSLKNMKVGDVITVSTGPTNTVEKELRVLAGKSIGRAGLDVKLDDWTAKSQKFTVKMVANPDKAKADQPHVIIMDGDRQGSGSAVGFGLIWNPKLGTNPDGTKGKGPLDDTSEGLFGRVLLQDKQSTEHETYNFIELDPNDKSAGGGRQLFDEIIKTGVVTMDPATNSVPGALALGTMTVNANNGSATLQLTGYHEGKDSRLGVVKQYIGQYSLDLLTMIDQETRINVIKGGPDANSGLTGDTEVRARYSDGGFTNYFHNYTTNAARQVTKEKFVLTAEGVKKDEMIDALRDGAIKTIRLHTANGATLTGQDAVTWMRTHEDGWYGGNDEVNVVVDMGTRDNADAFSKTFIADQKKFHDDQQDGFFENIFYEIGQNQWDSPEMAIATLTAPDLFSTPDTRGHLEDHQNAKNANENFQVMSGSGMGNLLGSMNHYWTHAGKAETYPISVDIYVEWTP